MFSSTDLDETIANQPLASIIQHEYPIGTLPHNVRGLPCNTIVVVAWALRVKCRLQIKDYPTGLKITKQQMASLNLRRHAVLPDWNYTLFPRENLN